jgi:uncharacterized protein (TIGR03067 family)
MKLCLPVAALLLAAAVARPQDEASKSDLKKMEGTWKVTLHEMEGKKTTDEENAKADVKLVIKASKYALSIGGKEIAAGTIKLDASKKPSTIDALTTSGPQEGKTMQGIYEVKGDEMRVCFAQPGKERPTAFSTKEGSGHLLLGYKRIKE